MSSKTPREAADQVMRLRESCIDYNGRPLSDGAEPRSIPHCAEVRAAADTIESLSAERSLLLDQEHQLSDAYLRLRRLIPGAFNTGEGWSSAMIWAHVETKLQEALASATSGEKL